MNSVNAKATSRYPIQNEIASDGLEDRLDQCWDLLRQRNAKQSARLNPDEATARSVDTVEHYQQ